MLFLQYHGWVAIHHCLFWLVAHSLLAICGYTLFQSVIAVGEAVTIRTIRLCAIWICSVINAVRTLSFLKCQVLESG